MIESRSTLERKLGLPADLREWFPGRSLLAVVLRASHSTESQEEGATLARPLPCGRPRVLLSVLTYCYSVGLFPSEEIEAQTSLDLQLRYLSGRSGLSAVDLRRFRRNYRPLLQNSLARLLRQAWELHGRPSDVDVSSELQDCFGVVAEARINQAVLADTMALDN